MKKVILVLGMLISLNLHAQYDGCCPGLGGGDGWDFSGGILDYLLKNASNEPVLVKCANQNTKLSFVRTERMDVYDHWAGNADILDTKFTSGAFRLNLGNLPGSYDYKRKYPGLEFKGGYYSKKISEECDLDLFYPDEFLKHLASGTQNQMEAWIICGGHRQIESLTCSAEPVKN